MIQRTIHQIWVGSAPPDHVERSARSWRAHHPRWRYKLWTDHELPLFLPSWIRDLYERAEEIVPVDAIGQFRSDLARYAILALCGGLYVDTDTLCLRPMDEILEGKNAWAAMEDAHWVGNTYVASEAYGTVISHVLNGLERNINGRRGGWRPNKLTGPKYLTPIWKEHGGATSPSRLFFPYSYNDVKRGTVPTVFDEDVVAVHEWRHTRDLMEAKKR